MYFYSTREDAKQNELTTSYNKKSMRDQYGKGGRNYDGFMIADITDNNFRKADDMNDLGGDEVIVRSFMKHKNAENASGTNTTSGNFELLTLREGKWAPTGFRAASYGAANTLMKSLIEGYGRLLVVEHNPKGGAAPKNSEEEGYQGGDEYSPF